MLIVQYYPEGSVNISEGFRKQALLGMTVHSVNVKRLAKRQPHADIDGNHYIRLISSLTLHWVQSPHVTSSPRASGASDKSWVLTETTGFLKCLFSSGIISLAPRWIYRTHLAHKLPLLLCEALKLGPTLQPACAGQTEMLDECGEITQEAQENTLIYIHCPTSLTLTQVCNPLCNVKKMGCSGSTCFHVEAVRYNDLCPFWVGINIPLHLDHLW